MQSNGKGHCTRIKIIDKIDKQHPDITNCDDQLDNHFHQIQIASLVRMLMELFCNFAVGMGRKAILAIKPTRL